MLLPESTYVLPEDPPGSCDPLMRPSPRQVWPRQQSGAQRLRDTVRQGAECMLDEIHAREEEETRMPRDQIATQEPWKIPFDPFLNSMSTGTSLRTPSKPTPLWTPFRNAMPIQPPKILPTKRRSPHINPSSSANCSPPQDPKIKRQRTTEHTRASEAVKIAVGLLEEEFNLREAASEEFPPEIVPSHIRTSVNKYENEMSAASERSVCCCCGRLIATGDIYKIHDEAHFILPPQRILDRCGHHENSWDFCTACHGAVSRGNIPKFSALNLVNVTTCQDYPSALEDLTAIEECLIAKCHPVGTILKLRPGGRSSPVTYNAMRGHMIVIPQDPGPLLQILPSPELQLDNLIKVIWLGKRSPVDADLKPFLQVRKDKVLAALQYLVQHNHLYRDLTINYSMIDSWSKDFIPPEIRDNIICLGSSDHHERLLGRIRQFPSPNPPVSGPRRAKRALPVFLVAVF
jgi:hypothetical protein